MKLFLLIKIVKQRIMKQTFWKTAIAVALVFVLFPTYFGHVLARVTVGGEPTYYTESHSSDEVTAAWDHVEQKRGDNADRINEEWHEFVSDYKESDDLVDWIYWTKFGSHKVESASNTVGGWIDNLKMSAKKALALGKDSSIESLNYALRKTWEGELYLAFPVFTGLVWLFGFMMAIIGLITALHAIFDYVSFGAYGKVKGGAGALKFIPIIGTVITIAFLLFEIYVAYKIGVMALIYEMATMPNISAWLYDVFGWTVYTNPWWPTLLFGILTGLLVKIVYDVIGFIEKIIKQ